MNDFQWDYRLVNTFFLKHKLGPWCFPAAGQDPDWDQAGCWAWSYAGSLSWAGRWWGSPMV